MKQICLFLVLFAFGLSAQAQDCNFLVGRNGFRTIKLGSKVNDYPNFQLRNSGNEELFRRYFAPKAEYVYTGTENDKLATARILYIFLTTQDDKISEIKVITEKVLNVYAILNRAYGEATTKQNTKFTWKTETIECTLEGDGMQIPGYHITYKDVSKDRLELKRMSAKSRKEAQEEL